MPSRTSSTKPSHQDLEAFILAVLPTPVDFIVSDEGSVFIFTPLTPAAREWVAEFLPEGAMRWAGPVVVEHRYISDIISGARRDGLVVKLQ
jgi:hypothetical protein